MNTYVMNGSCRINITVPSTDLPIIEYGRHFSVNGTLEHENELPEDAVLTVKLLDEDGRTVRYSKQSQKNNSRIYLYHPELTAYDDAIDPGREELKRFGFAELMVNDLSCPEASLRDATLKCWYSDSEFKAVIVSATDVAHGAALNDGIGYTDENGDPYRALDMGSYTVCVELASSDGEPIASASKKIEIGNNKNQVICRFNPPEHKQNMLKWSEKMGFSIIKDVLPGYLDPYMGKWFYHMGLLPMYRANDIAVCDGPKIHMFVYLIDPTSTSYETELAFLQTKGRVGDPEKFTAYHYDIGEAVLAKGTPQERRGKIVSFGDGEFLSLYRIDTVTETARENLFDLSCESVISSQIDLENITVCAGDDIAITGVVKPWQLDAKAFRLREDNVYDISSSVSAIKYVFDDGIEKKTVIRKLMMERINGISIGFSVFEFYNIFHVDDSLKGRTLSVEITACDDRGENPKARKRLALKVI